MTIEDAYSRIYAHVRTTGFQANGLRYAAEYRQEAELLLESLPPPQVATENDMRVVFQEIMRGHLEWAFHISDGTSRMSEYVKSAVGDDWNISEATASSAEAAGNPYWFHTKARWEFLRRGKS